MSAPKSPGDSAINTCEYVYLAECMKRYLQKFQVRFNNLTLEVNKMM